MTELSNGLSIELPERLSIRLSKELSKGLSETAANIYKMIYAYMQIIISQEVILRIESEYL